MDQICLGRIGNHTVMYIEGHHRLHYENRELNDYECQGLNCL